MMISFILWLDFGVFLWSLLTRANWIFPKNLAFRDFESPKLNISFFPSRFETFGKIQSYGPVFKLFLRSVQDTNSNKVKKLQVLFNYHLAFILWWRPFTNHSRFPPENHFDSMTALDVWKCAITKLIFCHFSNLIFMISNISDC